jgi:RHS repeat-associated protein
VQEQNTSTGTANLLTGLGLDEILTRTDASGTMGFLTDQIGSTSGLVNSSGSLQTTYTYEPFGSTSTSVTANGNPYQFTGRELDPNSGLYFMRNRYYSPTLQRFLSPDPSGLAGGDANLYAYVGNDPTNLIDPTGLLPIAVADPDMGSVGQYIRMRGDDGSLDVSGPCGGPCGDTPGVENAPFAPNIGPLQIQGGNLLLVGSSGSPYLFDYQQFNEQALKAYPNKAGRPDENHHVVPKYLGGYKNGPTVRLNPAYHQQITNAFIGAYKYGQPPPNATKLLEMLIEAYAQYPILLF